MADSQGEKVWHVRSVAAGTHGGRGSNRVRAPSRLQELDGEVSHQSITVRTNGSTKGCGVRAPPRLSQKRKLALIIIFQRRSLAQESIAICHHRSNLARKHIDGGTDVLLACHWRVELVDHCRDQDTIGECGSQVERFVEEPRKKSPDLCDLNKSTERLRLGKISCTSRNKAKREKEINTEIGECPQKTIK